jgi:multiple sugar transport system substrate-binding protein
LKAARLLPTSRFARLQSLDGGLVAMMADYRGLTWDHPRGRAALEFAAARARERGELDLAWDVQPLEGFESASVTALARDYDVIVLDHPHLGESVMDGALWPLEELFAAQELDRLRVQSVGPAQRSYLFDGRTWALPLDAATQVAARQPELLRSAPGTWDEVLGLAERMPVALSLAGPHALLTFASVCVALGEEPAATANRFVSAAVGRRAMDILGPLAELAPAGSASLNPIAMLERMAHTRDIAYCPLVFGYVNYSRCDRDRTVVFADAPALAPGSRVGSTLGGTGIAFSRRRRPGADVLDHVRQLLDPEAQRSMIPAHSGQPSARAAWDDDRVNADSNDFYRATRRTIEDAWVRPRYAGYIGFQSSASALIRDMLFGMCNPARGLAELDELHQTFSRERATP